MLLLEIIGQFLIEVIFIDFLGGILSRLNNSILKLRGIETRSIEEIKLDKIRKRYELKTVKLKREITNLEKGKKGVILEIIDLKSCIVEFENVANGIKQIKLKDLLLTKK